jgi:mRNA deadenylase 3'-5' endonuclease subunit Ccr4
MGNMVEPEMNGMFIFNHDSNIWEAGQVNYSKSFQNTLKIVTFNVWFDNYLQRERFDMLFQELETHSPDIICLQEGCYYYY